LNQSVEKSKVQLQESGANVSKWKFEEMKIKYRKTHVFIVDDKLLNTEYV